MRQLRVVPTLVVALACALMIALGVWQLDRLAEKEALLAQLAANQHLPAIAFPRTPDERALFRQSSATCLGPVSWHREAGRAADGTTGWRQIAQCRAGADTPGIAIQLGIAPDPSVRASWSGGAVRGYITHLPQHRSLLTGLWDRRPIPLMLVADTPLPGLKANPPADLSAVPNNHLAYAVQWFLFAGVAAIVYLVAALRRPATELAPDR